MLIFVGYVVALFATLLWLESALYKKDPRD